MKAGNISQTAWKRSVRRQLNSRREEALFTPSMEEPCTALRMADGGIVVTATADTSGNVPECADYAILKAVNDVASRGAEVIGVSVQLILPLSATEAQLKALAGSMDAVCMQAGIQLTCLKAETNPCVNQILTIATATGEAAGDSILRTEDAAAGQDILLCGHIALEGTLRILAEREEELSGRFVPSFIRQLKEQKKELFAARAIAAAGKAGAAAIHQIGSGGILAALWELAEASGIGMETELSKISIRQETVEICEFYNLNPYQMTSAGSFLITAKNGDAVVKALEGAGARAVRLGVATDGNARVITSGEEQRYLDRPAPDELMLWRERNCH